MLELELRIKKVPSSPPANKQLQIQICFFREKRTRFSIHKTKYRSRFNGSYVACYRQLHKCFAALKTKRKKRCHQPWKMFFFVGEGDFFALLASELIHPKTEEIYQRVQKTGTFQSGRGDKIASHNFQSSTYVGKSLLFQQEKNQAFFPRIEAETGLKTLIISSSKVRCRPFEKFDRFSCVVIEYEEHYQTNSSSGLRDREYSSHELDTFEAG